MFRISNLCVIILLQEILLIFAFNLEPRLPIIKRGVKGSYFGYSVSEHQIIDETTNEIKEHVLLVGAPKANANQYKENHAGGNHSGVVYRCKISTLTNDCKDLELEAKSREHESSISDDIIRDDQWLGVSIKSRGKGSYIVACAHRYIIKVTTSQWGLGICYSLDQKLQAPRVWEPCLNRAYGHEKFGYCQAGTSVDISEDNKLVIGTPGSHTWKGTVFSNSVPFKMLDDKTWYYGPLKDTTSPVENYSYLGMATTSGKFFNSETVFVGGAPRANGAGQVVFFKKQNANSSSQFIVLLILDGEQFASYYGFSLAALDINSDGLPDLCVGAPFYYSKEKGGAVYIYMNSAEGLSTNVKPIKLTGKADSRFGFAISYAGDLNQDGFPDLAVGAPYEGKGAVYIFLGSKNGILEEPSQVIRVNNLAEEAQRNLVTFGYSLSGGLDLDDNGYPDLLVGAYDSDAVFLLRARPIIDIITSVYGTLENIDPNRKGCEKDNNTTLLCFSFEACFQINSSFEHNINLKYRIEAETFSGNKFYRVKFNSSFDTETPNIVQKDFRLSRPKESGNHCAIELVYLKDKTDIQSPIKFKLSYTLIHKKPKMVPEGDPLPNINEYSILNQQEASRIFEATFLKDCGEDDKCEPDLRLIAELNLPKDPDTGNLLFYLGESHVNLSIIIYNVEEPAYDTALFVTHPSWLSYGSKKIVKGDQIECSPFNETILKCVIGNPMNRGEVELQIRFSSLNVTGEEKILKFELKANTTSNEKTPENDTILVANIIKVAELVLSSVSHPEHVFYSNNIVKEDDMMSGEDIGSLIIHTYEIFNYGQWIANEAKIIIKWPYHTDYGKWILYMMEAPQVIGNGFCEVGTDIINPLKLEVKKEEEYTDVTESKLSNSISRKKRQAPEEIRLDSRTANFVTLDCKSGSAKCHTFNCTIRDLKQYQNAIINIRSRLWSKTFVEDYANVDHVKITSNAQAFIDPIYNIVQKLENDYNEASTVAFPNIDVYKAPKEVPLWIIILAVCGGLLLLIFLILCLWKLGFFKRKKPGYIPAATTEKEKEFNNI